MPACKINQNLGNCYTGSVFSSLLSVVAAKVRSTICGMMSCDGILWVSTALTTVVQDVFIFVLFYRSLLKGSINVSALIYFICYTALLVCIPPYYLFCIRHFECKDSSLLNGTTFLH
jgi:hypothetical protein